MKKLLFLCSLLAGLLAPAWGQRAGFIGTTVTPTAASRGIDRVVYIAYRTDGRAGKGTLEDPFDGSTTAKFDSVLRTAVGHAEQGIVPGSYVVVNIGPGTFTTTGSGGQGNTNNLFRDSRAFVIRGSGRGVTTLQLAANTLTSGGRTKAYFFYYGGTLGNIDYLEVSDMTLDCNAANQPLVAANGNATLAAISAYTEVGYYHDLEVTGLYAQPAEEFPIHMNVRTDQAGVNAQHVFERIVARPRTPTSGSDNDNMLVIGSNDPSYGGTQRGTIIGAIRDCAVIGTGTEIAFGAGAFDQFLFERNYGTNLLYGINIEVYTNRNCVIRDNVFSYVVVGAQFKGSVGSQFGAFAFNRLENPRGGAVAFAGDTLFEYVFGNYIDSGYSLNQTEHQLLRGWASTNQFQLQGGTNMVLRDGVKITNLVLNAGSAAAPALSFVGDANTGLCWQGADNLGLTVGGSTLLGVTPTEVSFGARQWNADGSAAAPSITFGADQNTGFYRSAAGAVSFSSAGTSRVTFSSGGVAIQPLTNDRLIYTGVGNILSTVTVGSGLTFSSGTLSATAGAITNSASQVTGAGTGYTLTATSARVDFGTTDPQITLPEAGTYRVFALLEADSAPLGDGQLVEAKFYNSTDAADVANSTRVVGNSGGGTYDKLQLTLENIITVAASKTIQIYARDANAVAEGGIVSTGTSISYIKLY